MLETVAFRKQRDPWRGLGIPRSTAGFFAFQFILEGVLVWLRVGCGACAASAVGIGCAATWLSEWVRAAMNVVLGPLLAVIDLALSWYTWALIISAVLSWLVAFNVINTRNHFVYMVGDVLYRITEPLLRPIRRVIPAVNGVDLSPMVLILVIYFLREVLQRIAGSV